MVQSREQEADIRARQDEQFKRALAYFNSFVPGKVVSTHTTVVTKEMVEADRLELEYPEWDFPRGLGGGMSDGFTTGPNMRQQWKYFSPPRVGEKVTVKLIQVDKFVRNEIPWVVRETAVFGEDGRPICSNTGTWMLNGHRMGQKWAKETEAKPEGPYIK